MLLKNGVLSITYVNYHLCFSYCVCLQQQPDYLEIYLNIKVLKLMNYVHCSYLVIQFLLNISSKSIMHISCNWCYLCTYQNLGRYYQINCLLFNNSQSASSFNSLSYTHRDMLFKWYTP